MTLYEQLKADPTLRVHSSSYGLSEIDGINLLNIRRDCPIEVTFEGGEVETFTENGQCFISRIFPRIDISIYEPRKSNS
jgi:hypothetical protein